MESKNLRNVLEARIIERALKDEQFREELINNPKDAIEKELGLTLPSFVAVKVIEEQENELVLSLPHASTQIDEISEEELEAVAGGTALGTALGDASKQWGTCGPGTQCEIC